MFKHSEKVCLHQMRCAILPIPSLLAMLGMIHVLLTRLFASGAWLTKQVSFQALLKVTKSVKSHISFGVKSRENSLTRLFTQKVCFSMGSSPFPWETLQKAWLTKLPHLNQMS